MAEAMKVCVRFRPQNRIEKAKNAYIVVRWSDCGTMCMVDHPDKGKYPKPLTFQFDRAFGTNTPQMEVFEYAAKHLVVQLFQGFNATIFAYGQTGAGKTYSMEGELGSPHRGIIPRTVETIFEFIADADENLEFLLKVSYVEIYLEALRDLLSPKNNAMKIREGKHGVYIEGVCEMYVRDAVEVIDLLTMGAGNRTVSSTGMNAVSSRSHGVFMLKLESRDVTTGTKKMSKLMMVDLAGSEKVAKTGASGQLLEEAKKINQSLSALGNVMSALSGGKGHVAYRDSVLTRLLSDSLGGNCKTTLLIACSPSSYNVEETITTLRFGTRAKKIKNKAKINAEKTVAEYKRDVAKLQGKITESKTKYKDALKKIKALQKDLKASIAGDYVEGEGIYDKMLAGEKVNIKVEEEKKGGGEEEKSAPAPAAAAGPAQAAAAAEPTWDPAKQKELDEAEQRATEMENEILELKALLAQQQQNMDEAATPDLSKQVSDALEKKYPDRDDDSSDSEEKEAPEATFSHSRMMSFKDVSGGLISQEMKVQEIEVPKAPTNASELTPELLENVRRGLQVENNNLRQQVETLNKEILNARKQAAIHQERAKMTRDEQYQIEMECDKLMLALEQKDEEMSDLKAAHKRLGNNQQEAENALAAKDKEIQALKQRMAALERECERKIHQSAQESQRMAEEFIRQAQEQIQAFKRAGGVGGSSRQRGGRRGQAMGRLRDQYMQDMKAQQRKEQLYEAKMKEFEQKTLSDLHEIRLEQLKLKNSLKEKTRDYLQVKMKLAESFEDIRRLEDVIYDKDQKIQQQHQELQAFGELKKVTDSMHNEQMKKATTTIRKLKDQLRKMKDMNGEPEPQEEVPKYREFGYPEPQGNVHSAIELQKKQRVAIPLRGGGGRKGQQPDKRAPRGMRGGGGNKHLKTVMGPSGLPRPVSIGNLQGMVQNGAGAKDGQLFVKGGKGGGGSGHQQIPSMGLASGLGLPAGAHSRAASRHSRGGNSRHGRAGSRNYSVRG